MGLRENMIEVACGMKGVGKSYATLELLKSYVTFHKRPVLIFDVNDEYREIKSLDFNSREESNKKRGAILKQLCESKPCVRRIVPFNKDGSPMINSDFKVTFETIANNMYDSMILFEDINRFQSAFRGQTAVSTITTLRHRGIDIIIHYQSISKISTSLFENADYIRIHMVSDNPYRYLDRLPNSFVTLVGYLIVAKAYRDSFLYLQSNGIKAQDYKLNRSKYKNHQSKADGIFKSVYVGIQTAVVTGVTFEEFSAGVKEYYKNYRDRIITQTMKRNKCDYEKALDVLVDKAKIYYSK